MEPNEVLYPKVGGSEGFILPWLKSVGNGNKVGTFGFAAFGVIAEHLTHCFNVLFMVVVILWGMDFLLGVVKVARDPKIEWKWDKAADSLLKLLILLAIAITVAVAELAVLELTGFDPKHKLLSGSYAILIYMELGSIVKNLKVLLPGSERVLVKVLALLKKAEDNG
jgi:hypothetical protein